MQIHRDSTPFSRPNSNPTIDDQVKNFAKNIVGRLRDRTRNTNLNTYSLINHIKKEFSEFEKFCTKSLKLTDGTKKQDIYFTFLNELCKALDIRLPDGLRGNNNIQLDSYVDYFVQNDYRLPRMPLDIEDTKPSSQEQRVAAPAPAPAPVVAYLVEGQINNTATAAVASIQGIPVARLMEGPINGIHPATASFYTPSGLEENNSVSMSTLTQRRHVESILTRLVIENQDRTDVFQEFEKIVTYTNYLEYHNKIDFETNQAVKQFISSIERNKVLFSSSFFSPNETLSQMEALGYFAKTTQVIMQIQDPSPNGLIGDTINTDRINQEFAELFPEEMHNRNANSAQNPLQAIYFYATTIKTTISPTAEILPQLKHQAILMKKYIDSLSKLAELTNNQPSGFDKDVKMKMARLNEKIMNALNRERILSGENKGAL